MKIFESWKFISADSIKEVLAGIILFNIFIIFVIGAFIPILFIILPVMLVKVILIIVIVLLNILLTGEIIITQIRKEYPFLIDLKLLSCNFRDTAYTDVEVHDEINEIIYAKTKEVYEVYEEKKVLEIEKKFTNNEIIQIDTKLNKCYKYKYNNKRVFIVIKDEYLNERKHHVDLEGVKFGSNGWSTVVYVEKELKNLLLLANAKVILYLFKDNSKFDSIYRIVNPEKCGKIYFHETFQSDFLSFDNDLDDYLVKEKRKIKERKSMVKRSIRWLLFGIGLYLFYLFTEFLPIEEIYNAHLGNSLIDNFICQFLESVTVFSFFGVAFILYKILKL
ncbi:MAG: hypothetical protein P9L95_10325 [Candidatus Tenebribacter mawsonii]|nr:hypothetical protein [Candidatus Tenebribacter mawsonii]